MGTITGEQITAMWGGGLFAQVFGALHDGTEALKRATGHVGDGHFGWRTAAAGYRDGWPVGGSVVYCGCGGVLVPASVDGDEDLTGSSGGPPEGSR